MPTAPLRTTAKRQAIHEAELRNVLQCISGELGLRGATDFDSEYFGALDSLPPEHQALGEFALRITEHVNAARSRDWEPVVEHLHQGASEISKLLEWLDGAECTDWRERLGQLSQTGGLLRREGTTQTVSSESTEVLSLLEVLQQQAAATHGVMAILVEIVGRSRHPSMDEGWYGPHGPGPEAHLACLLHQRGWAYPDVATLLGKVSKAPKQGEAKADWQSRRTREGNKLQRLVKQVVG